MTVFAGCKWNFFFEVAPEVAGGASDGSVFPLKRIFGLGMVEIVARQHGFPATRSVADFARFLKLAMVRIEMAIRAGAELHISIAGRPPGGVWLVALLAWHLNVKSSQWITCFRMVEFLGRLPTFHVVTLRTLIAELPLVGIGVTRRTSFRLAKKGLRGVLILDQFAQIREHM